jgi:MFS family permease
MHHPVAAGPDPRAALQRRTLRVLVAAQILAGLGQSAAAAGALLALEVTGSEALAGLPLAFLVLGSAAVVVPISARSRRAGRRAGLTLALVVAACGAAGVVAAGALGSFPLLLAAHALFGAGNAAVMLARYAAADLSTPAARGRAIGTVVFATTFGAVLGPNLLTPAGELAGAVGLPALTGLYLVAAAVLLAAAGVLSALLRPDPLLAAVRLQPPARVGEPAGGSRAAPPPAPGLVALLATPAAAAGLATMVVANFVMVAVMTMAPVHLHRGGHGLTAVGVVVSVHVAGMFAPAPLTGALTDRLGPLPVAGGGRACWSRRARSRRWRAGTSSRWPPGSRSWASGGTPPWWRAARCSPRRSRSPSARARRAWASWDGRDRGDGHRRGRSRHGPRRLRDARRRRRGRRGGPRAGARRARPARRPASGGSRPADARVGGPCRAGHSGSR